MIDAGADVIFGHHAHRLQPMDTYRGRPIFYGLGNFVWPSLSVEGSTTAVARVIVRPNGNITGRLLPARIVSDGHRPREYLRDRIETTLGRGGMSVVYLAEDPRLARRVAIKVLAPELADNETFRNRFIRESQLAAGLDHPNIVPVYEAGEVDGRLFIAMRYVQGVDLRTSDGRLTPERTARLIRPMTVPWTPRIVGARAPRREAGQHPDRARPRRGAPVPVGLRV